jgi:hypothetical protein
MGAGLYGIAALLAYALPTPMGGNISRLGSEFAAPLLIGVLATRRGRGRIQPAVALGVLVALAAWQWLAPVREASKVVGDPSYHAAYYAPLIRFLERDAGGPARIEVPFTRAHWEAVHLAPYFPLARGWQTQLDVKYNALFYRHGAVTADAYRAWLDGNAVAWVALPDAPLDPSGRAEARLVRGGLAYLEPVWRDAHWRVFRVRDTEPLVTGAAELVSLTSERIVLRAPRGDGARARALDAVLAGHDRRLRRAFPGWVDHRRPAARRHRGGRPSLLALAPRAPGSHVPHAAEHPARPALRQAWIGAGWRRSSACRCCCGSGR